MEFQKMPNVNGVSCYFDCRLGVSSDAWENQSGTDAITLYNPVIRNDYVEVIGSDTSYGVLTHGGNTGGTVTNQDYCVRYFIFKNLSNVFANWKTIIGNETGDSYCSTIAMDGSGGLKFTRNDILFTSYKCTDWHVIAIRSRKVDGYTDIWCDGVLVGTASKCAGWAVDTYLSRGSNWSYADNNTAYRAIIVSDENQTDDDIVENSMWLKSHYIDNFKPYLYSLKFLVVDASKLYTIENGVLVELATTDVTADIFNTYGFYGVPDSALLVGLDNPEVLYWQDSEDDLPILTATVTATPHHQMVVSQAIDLMHSSIKGISGMAVDCKGDVLFAVSFDNKATWMQHNGTDWVNVADELTGMTKTELETITTEQWQVKYELSSDMYIRCTLTDATQSITSVNISFIN